MASEQITTQVEAPDPELNTSSIVEDTDEEFEVTAQEVEDLPVCFFNNSSFSSGDLTIQTTKNNNDG
jgi:hypothetical protein